MAEQNKGEEFDEVVESVKSMLNKMKFGSITLVVQDGKVVQLEKNEKVRIK
ncbi:YezD family protein [Mangrovibacillus sp. Mu-81]|uniref:YezD family protein n=1 Tax=Mangrovibacillus sp. Mu-81 TaxID=3121478 RepID=UPI002FE4A707